MYGSAFVIWNRILLSLGLSTVLLFFLFFFLLMDTPVWYGFQAWIGGECLYVCLLALSPSLDVRL
jgi:NCS1 family nucleobase:cation symporter-1